MFFRWLKHVMPRGLYGRTALILVLPVVTLQLVVSVVFIGRHLGDVTTKMSQALARELLVIVNDTAVATTPEEALERLRPMLTELNMQARFVPQDVVPKNDQIRWNDFSADVARDTIRHVVPGVLALQFPNNDIVHAFYGSRFGPLQIDFDRRRVRISAPHQLIVTMVVFSMLMTVIAFVYMRNQLRPITRLARAAQAFGRGHNIVYQPAGAIEVRAAGHAFLDMRDRIERQIEQRTMMLSGVSHDLRTPLTRLRLGLAMMDDTEDLLGDVDEMQKLLDAFLDFSRGTVEGDPELVDPVALIEQIVDDATRCGRQVTLIETEGAGLVPLRPMAIRRAVENLIGNAVRYGSRAEVSVAVRDTSLRIRVEDDGPGIAEADRAEAVKPFFRLDPARNQNLGSGVGLGLAIVADVASVHGGSLQLGRSDRLGGLRADIMIGR
ncbi:ATP-binding protein [Pontibaca salina]|uniref:histidine kinase n=1 Tax=Pontibaca salina TaxID=2795731 RepID=A0A934HQE3_9RHOB|nr:ATP-binding protein [Pontibaca salina]MBI6628268.1 HAMP domain-containing protein [Pontibaca salina]